MQKLLRLFLPIALGMISGQAIADIQFNGFLSVGGGLIDTDKRDYEGFDDSLSFDTDTVFGLQTSSQLSDNLSATGQIVSRGSDGYEAEIEWAFLTYQMNDELQIRMGRLRAPFFSFSDFLEVGYAYPWIRPPVEVYGNVPFNGVAGIDAIYTQNLDTWDLTWQGYLGRFRDDVDVP